jgi:hypothetical protein
VSSQHERPEDERGPNDRRRFLSRLAGGGAALAGAPLFATAAPWSSTAAGAAQLDSADIAAFAESVERVLVVTYEGILPVLSGELGPVAEEHLAHHRAHAEALAELAGDRSRGEPNPVLLDAVTPELEALATSGASLRFALALEEQVVATYAWSLTVLERSELSGAVAAILPVEAAHATTLAHIVGTGPDGWFPTGAFETTDLAAGIDPAVHPI